MMCTVLCSARAPGVTSTGPGQRLEVINPPSAHDWSDSFEPCKRSRRLLAAYHICGVAEPVPWGNVAFVILIVTAILTRSGWWTLILAAPDDAPLAP